MYNFLPLPGCISTHDFTIIKNSLSSTSYTCILSYKTFLYVLRLSKSIKHNYNPRRNYFSNCNLSVQVFNSLFFFYILCFAIGQVWFCAPPCGEINNYRYKAFNCDKQISLSYGENMSLQSPSLVGDNLSLNRLDH